MQSRGLTFVIATIFLLILSACSNKPVAPIDVQVTLTEFGIDSTITNFKVGQPYRFIITNAGALNHELTIMPPSAGMGAGHHGEGHDMEVGHHGMTGAMLHVGESDLPPGATVAVEFEFSESKSLGQLEFACYLAGHYEAGMFSPITVAL
jgi:uncharacterized cupredoxin-like copper-binding protein